MTLNVKDAVLATLGLKTVLSGTDLVIAHAATKSDGSLVDPATSDRQDTGNTSLAAIAAAQGAPADTAATSDTGTFSMIALVKRMLQKLTTGLYARGTYNNTFPTLADTADGTIQFDSRNNLRTTICQSNNTATVSTVAEGGSASNAGLTVIARHTQLNRATGTLSMEALPVSTARLPSAAATTNPTSVKSSLGNLYQIQGYCAAAAPVFLKLYNKASAPTVGTDTPIWTRRLAPGAEFSLPFSGFLFSTGLAFAITAARADSDTTAVAAGDVTDLNILFA